MGGKNHYYLMDLSRESVQEEAVNRQIFCRESARNPQGIRKESARNPQEIGRKSAKSARFLESKL